MFLRGENKKMEHVDSVPFSSLIAGMLLVKRSVSSMDIVNAISRIGASGVTVEDENDDLEVLSLCVEMSRNYDFYLREEISYETTLCTGVRVIDFLMLQTNEKILSYLKNDPFYEELYSRQVGCFFSGQQKNLDTSNFLLLSKAKKRQKRFGLKYLGIRFGES